MNIARIAPIIIITFCNFSKLVHQIINNQLAIQLVKNNEIFKDIYGTEKRNSFVQNAADPDNEKYKNKAEGYNHYFHWNAYSNESLQKYINSIDEYPELEGFIKFLDGYIKENKDDKTYNNIKNISTYVKSHGYLPFAIHKKIEILKALVKERKENIAINNKTNVEKIDAQILKESIYLAHYVADLCTPLHLNKNYDGMYDYQKGIHSMWESLIPNVLIKEEYNINNYNSKLHKIKTNKINKYIFKLIENGYKLSDDILKKELDIYDEYKYNYKKIYFKERFKSRKYARLCAKYFNKGIHEQISKAVSLLYYIFNDIIFV